MSDFDEGFDDWEDEEPDVSRANALQALSNAIASVPPRDEDGDDMEAILVKWIVISEWADSSGNVWLTRRWASGGGGALSSWDMKGMLHEALYGDRW